MQPAAPTVAGRLVGRFGGMARSMRSRRRVPDGSRWHHGGEGPQAGGRGAASRPIAWRAARHERHPPPAVSGKACARCQGGAKREQGRPGLGVARRARRGSDKMHDSARADGPPSRSACAWARRASTSVTCCWRWACNAAVDVPLRRRMRGRGRRRGRGRGRAVRVGDRLFGYAPGALADDVTVPAAFLARVPDGMTLEEAAAQPVAFLTAVHGLPTLAQLRRGERVLIHAGAGASGSRRATRAARRRRGVRHGRQRRQARPPARDGCPRTRSIRARWRSPGEILALTAAWASTSSSTRSRATSSTRACARWPRAGRFLELGKRDLLAPETLAARRPERRVPTPTTSAASRGRPRVARADAGRTAGRFADRSLQPLPVTSFALDDARDALRFMAQARHVGKIVLKPSPRATRGEIAVRGDAS